MIEFLKRHCKKAFAEFFRPLLPTTKKTPSPDQYYLQDKRGFVGNDVLWWAKGGNGYTSDLREAEVYTKEQAERQRNSRYTDVPWLKSYIDSKARPAVDFQYIKRDEMREHLRAMVRR